MPTTFRRGAGTAKAFWLTDNVSPKPGDVAVSLAASVNGSVSAALSSVRAVPSALPSWDCGSGCRVRDRGRQRLGDVVQALPARGREGSVTRAGGVAAGQLPRSAQRALPVREASHQAARRATIAFTKAGAG